MFSSFSPREPCVPWQWFEAVHGALDLMDTEAVPKGATICNVFGHEPAIAEYVIMTMLVLTHRLFETGIVVRHVWRPSRQEVSARPRECARPHRHC